MHSPLKKVLHKIEDSYQTYINTYKTHTIATHHGGTGQPSEKDPNPQEQDVDVPNEYQEDANDFENVEHEHHAWLRDLTNEIDYLQHKVEANETWPTEAISHLEHKLNRVTLTLHPSAPPESLDEVLQQYTETYVLHKRKCPLWILYYKISQYSMAMILHK